MWFEPVAGRGRQRRHSTDGTRQASSPSAVCRQEPRTSAHAETEPASLASGRTEAAAGPIRLILAHASAGTEPARLADGRSKAEAGTREFQPARSFS